MISKLAFAAFLLSSPSVLAGETISLEQGISKMLGEGSQFIILGEDHGREGLAKGVNALMEALKKQSDLRCLFLELSKDLQASLNESVQRRDLAEFSRTIYRSREFAYMKAFERRGFTNPIQLENIRLQFVEHENQPLLNFPFDQLTIDFLEKNKVKVIAFDADSNSQEILDSTYFNLMDHYGSPSLERDLEQRKAGNARSKIMSARIAAAAETQQCGGGLIVVGFAHLYSDKFFRTWTQDFHLTPLQDLLKEAGYKSSVVIAEEQKVLSTLVFDLEKDLTDRFDNYFGRFLIPKFP